MIVFLFIDNNIIHILSTVSWLSVYSRIFKNMELQYSHAIKATFQMNHKVENLFINLL